jgi:oligosaccharyltransferase complex subunit alpha (ribophorin I)
LETEFNRITYDQSQQVHDKTNVLKRLVFDLPVGSSDVYYRDQVGNVSTSHFRNEKDKSVLELLLRFPIFGGWKTSWYHGYNVPLAGFVRKSDEKYIFKVNFIENVQNMIVDDAEIKIILPEGAR